MKTFNKSEIFTQAHNLYSNGSFKTFGAALTEAWKQAKIDVTIEEWNPLTVIAPQGKKDHNLVWTGGNKGFYQVATKTI